LRAFVLSGEGLDFGAGLIPDMRGTRLLPEPVGQDIINELTNAARMAGGEEAVRIGLATRADPDPLGAALAMAKEIAARGPRDEAATWPLRQLSRRNAHARV
jgi:enoyl-CoA hydratase/carnithine racemase